MHALKIGVRLSIASLFCIGCSIVINEAPPPAEDGGRSVVDSGTPRQDVGRMAGDTGREAEDTGDNRRDTGIDAGQNGREDAGPVDAGPPVELPGNACREALQVTGAVITNLGELDYTGEPATVSLNHSQAADAENDGCLARATVTLQKLGGRGCTLTLNFESQQGSRLLLRSATLEADAFCPGWPPEGRGTYRFEVGNAALYPSHQVPGRLVDRVCMGPMRLDFHGEVFTHAQPGWEDRIDAGPPADAGISGLSLNIAGLNITGNMVSSADPNLLCPMVGECGDGMPDPGEACDDGNDSQEDACTTECLAATCRDGHRWRGIEACDDGNEVDTDFCTNSCEQHRCGDGIYAENARRTGAGCIAPYFIVPNEVEQWGIDWCRNNTGTNLEEGCEGNPVRCGVHAWGIGVTEETNIRLRACAVTRITEGLYRDCQDRWQDRGFNWPDDVGLLLPAPTDLTTTNAPNGSGLWRDRCFWPNNACHDPGNQVCDIINSQCRPIRGEEACDDGNQSNEDACLNDCTENVCGDGFLNPGVEECDGGNLCGDNCQHLSITQVALGAAHSCALVNNGTIRCWGMNSFGQLGDTSTSERVRPVLVAQLANATQISLGYSHSCARTSDGRVHCWGNNFYGQLGVGGGSHRSTPEAVLNLENTNEISVGFFHSCALMANRTAQCWGRNEYGELGDGSTSNRPSPVPVQNLENISQLALGENHSCALLNDGTVYCWGLNRFGQLGNGETSWEPQAGLVSELVNVRQISLGKEHSCALLNNGSVKCWGHNGSDQLGNGSGNPRPLPTLIQNLNNVINVKSGNFHTCALIGDGTVRCWGANQYGQLGNNQDMPINLANVEQLAVGFFHGCARLADNTLHCWGRNQSGQLGDGSHQNRATPVLVDFDL